MQRHYGLNIDMLGREFDILHLSALVAYLPLGSQLMAEFDERYAYTIADTHLHNIYGALVGKVIPFPWERAGNGLGLDYEPMGSDEIEDYLFRSSWKEVEEDGRII